MKDDPQNPELASQVLLAQKGESAAFSFLIRSTQDRLFRFCLYLCHDRALAQDLCQEAFVRAFEKISSLKESDRFLSWLFKMARNLYLDYVKSPQNSKLATAMPLEEVLEDTVSASTPPSSDPTVTIQIQQALAGLEPEDRMILLLVDLEEHTYSEAAGIVGISESNLRFKLHHIRKAFAARYGK